MAVFKYGYTQNACLDAYFSAEVATDDDAEADDVESIEKGVVTPWCYSDHDYSVPPTSASVNARASVVESIDKIDTVVMPWCSADHDYSELPKSCEKQLEDVRSSSKFEQLTEVKKKKKLASFLQVCFNFYLGMEGGIEEIYLK